MCKFSITIIQRVQKVRHTDVQILTSGWTFRCHALRRNPEEIFKNMRDQFVGLGKRVAQLV
jgi:hypothetical protein